MKNTGELSVNRMGSMKKEDFFVNSLGDLKIAERESVKQALKELDRMLADLSKRNLP